MLSIHELQQRRGREVQVPKRVYEANQCSKGRQNSLGTSEGPEGTSTLKKKSDNVHELQREWRNFKGMFLHQAHVLKT